MKKKIAIVLTIVMIMSAFSGLTASAEENIVYAPAGSPSNLASLINNAQAGTRIIVDQANNPNNWAFSITASNVTVRPGVIIEVKEGAALQIGGAGLNGSLINNGTIIVNGGLTFNTGASTIHNFGTIIFGDDSIVRNNAGTNDGHRGQIRIHGDNSLMSVPEGTTIIQSTADSTVKLVNINGNTGFRSSIGWANEYWDGVSFLEVRTPPVPADLIAWVTGESEVWEDEYIEYTIWLDASRELVSVNGFAVSVTVNDILHHVDVELPNGFSIYTGPNWVQDGNNWKATFEVGMPASAINIDGEFELMTLRFSAKDAGGATFTLDEAKVYERPDNRYNIVLAEITVDTINTEVNEVPDFVLVYSIYDLDKSGVVDFTDVLIALRAFGMDDEDLDWMTLLLAYDSYNVAVTPDIADVNNDGSVDMLDIAEIIANYGPAEPVLTDPRTLP